jgi:zinc finger MYND domain-containing protein 10
MLENQSKEIDFTVAMSCLSLIRFITDHMEVLPASIVHQLMDTTDIPLVLVPLLE